MKNRTFKIHITDKNTKTVLTQNVYKHRHFENVFLLFIQNSDQIDFKYITNHQIMRSVLNGTKGGLNKVKINYIKKKYKNNEFLIALKALSKTLKIHNISMLIKRVKGNYKTMFSNLKNNSKASNPKAKKLNRMTSYSINIDQIAWSLRRKNILGINLSDKMFYMNIKHDFLTKICGDIKNIKSLTIQFSNKEIYLNFRYETPENTIIPETIKMASIDIGINNLATIFINDETSKSIIVDGKMFKQYNSEFNRMIGKLNESISNEVTQTTTVKDKSYPTKWTTRGYELKRFITFLYEKRNRFFYNEFHKQSKRISEWLELNGVSHLILSKSLSELKNNGKINIGKSNQNFIQIPIIKFLNYIEYKCNDKGIKVDYINESNTSKCSCISDDVNVPVNITGKRIKRGLFLDTKINKVFNADINGAVNHIRKFTGQNFNWISNFMFKLCNPIKISCDYDFIKLNNVSNKVLTVSIG